jgi:hypothetical protein
LSPTIRRNLLEAFRRRVGGQLIDFVLVLR